MIRPIVLKADTEKFRLVLRYHSPDLEAGATIAAAEAAVLPLGLTLTGSVIIIGNEIHQMIEGGTKGIEYDVRFKVTLSNGHIYNHPIRDSVVVRVSRI